MIDVYYDLHIHSCLSPCADDDMTPTNIVNMAVLKELDVIAITDHNTCKNCPAAILAGERAGLLVIAGMELETVEEIHTVCLFENLNDALEFEKEIKSGMLKIRNNPHIFGNQIVMDENENILSEEENLLITATKIGIYEVQKLVSKYDGCAFIAHIDRESHGILSILGELDDMMGFKSFEISNNANPNEYKLRFPDYRILKNSDSHQLGQISEKDNKLEIMELSAHSIINCIKYGK